MLFKKNPSPTCYRVGVNLCAVSGLILLALGLNTPRGWAQSNACTVATYGTLTLDAPSYWPLDTVTVTVNGRTQGDSRCTIRVCDPGQREYFCGEVALTNNVGRISFIATGPLGAHYVYLTWPGEKRYSRYHNFQLDAATCVESCDADFDRLFPFTREAMLLGRREYQTPRGKFVGYISGDTLHFDGIWLRDWVYGLPAYKYWEREMSCGLDRFLENQAPDGMMPDGIERNGHTWRVPLESDVEYLMTLAVWQTWQVTGDDTWLMAALPRLEQALRYIQTDPVHWDSAHQLVKRQHSCDTWDFDIDGASDQGQHRHVIANCDQSGYYLAFTAMAAMHQHLGHAADATRWQQAAAAYRQRAVALLWDGTKFLHHVHLDNINHGDFDESQQLAMGNTWAMTRGLATPEQSRRIIDEYRLRQKTTGDAYPWWSLQPGYPDRLNYFPSRPFCRQGGYANGGLMPWVGGELCHAAFRFGREDYGVKLLRQYADHLRRTGGVQVWYWPNGEPGFRTPNEVNYPGWGMAEWVNALLEGLAGIHDASGQMRQVQVSPRWATTPVKQVRVMTRYAVANSYFAYRLQTDVAGRTLTLATTGSGQAAEFHVLLPAGWRPRTGGVTWSGKPIEFSREPADASSYVRFTAADTQTGTAHIACE